MRAISPARRASSSAAARSAAGVAPSGEVKEVDPAGSPRRGAAGCRAWRRAGWAGRPGHPSRRPLRGDERFLARGRERGGEGLLVDRRLVGPGGVEMPPTDLAGAAERRPPDLSVPVAPAVARLAGEAHGAVPDAAHGAPVGKGEGRGDLGLGGRRWRPRSRRGGRDPGIRVRLIPDDTPIIRGLTRVEPLVVAAPGPLAEHDGAPIEARPWLSARPLRGRTDRARRRPPGVPSRPRGSATRRAAPGRAGRSRHGDPLALAGGGRAAAGRPGRCGPGSARAHAAREPRRGPRAIEAAAAGAPGPGGAGGPERTSRSVGPKRSGAPRR